MQSPKEREIIERCLAISIWNHRSGKSAIKGNLEEVNLFQDKIRKEIQTLEKLVNEEISHRCSRNEEKEIHKLSKVMKFRSFLNKVIGREERRVPIS